MTESLKLLSLEEEALEAGWYKFPDGNFTKIVDGIRYATSEAWEALEIDVVVNLIVRNPRRRSAIKLVPDVLQNDAPDLPSPTPRPSSSP